MATLSTDDQIRIGQMMTRRTALSLEMWGMRRSRSPSAYSICKSEYRLKGSKKAVFEQMNNLIETELKKLGDTK